MATRYNQVYFGHELPVKLSEELKELEFTPGKKIGDRHYQLGYPYGGDFDAEGACFGLPITDTFYDTKTNQKQKIDDLANNLDTIVIEYEQFIELVKDKADKKLDSNISTELINFLDNNSPKLYSVQADT
jgi:hypothetical protein